MNSNKQKPSPHQEEWAERLKKAVDNYSWNCEMSDGSGYEQIEQIVKEALTTLHKADCERFRGMLDKEVQGTIMEHEGQKFVSASTREQVAVNQALSNITHALSKMEEEK